MTAPAAPTVVAVTGATGLVGRAVVSLLVRSGKFKVVALGRRKQALDELAASVMAECRADNGAAGGSSQAGGTGNEDAESGSGSGADPGAGRAANAGHVVEGVPRFLEKKPGTRTDTIGDVRGPMRSRRDTKSIDWGNSSEKGTGDHRGAWAEAADQLPATERLVLKECDVGDAAGLEQAFSGASVVVHAAGYVDALGDRKAIFKVNVQGTDNVLAAARKQNLKQMIHISSLSVITGQTDQFDVDESAPLVTCGEAYADSKVEAERHLAVVMKSGPLAITILRPGFIYGPGERAWLPRVIENIRCGKAVLVDGGLRQTNVIYSGNLAMAVESAILNSLAYGEIFNLTDGEKISKKALFDEISEGLSLPLVQKNLPRDTVKSVFAIVAAFKPFLPRPMQAGLARFSPGAFRLVAVNQGFSIRKAEQLLDYKNRISFKDGMAHTLKGFR